jgi:acetoin utilization deacetylase AcuC-like enzyme
MRSNQPDRVQLFLLLNLLLSCSILKAEATMTTPSVLIVSGCTPDMLQYDDSTTAERKEPRLTATEKRNDKMDSFNHPRRRKAMILQELGKKITNGDSDKVSFTFEKPSSPSPDLNIYAKHSITSERLIEFLTNGWERWEALGENRDTLTSMAMPQDDEDTDAPSAPPLIPGNVILHRDPHQRPSKNVMGQIGFFCTDTCTPVFDQLYEELLWDAAVMQQAAEQAKNHAAVYALGTHPGHHAGVDSFGGYCYVNHAALVAKLLQQSQQQQQDESNNPSSLSKVAILDVDYVSNNV